MVWLPQRHDDMYYYVSSNTKNPPLSATYNVQRVTHPPLCQFLSHQQNGINPWGSRPLWHCCFSFPISPHIIFLRHPQCPTEISKQKTYVLLSPNTREIIIIKAYAQVETSMLFKIEPVRTTSFSNALLYKALIITSPPQTDASIAIAAAPIGHGYKLNHLPQTTGTEKRNTGSSSATAHHVFAVRSESTLRFVKVEELIPLMY